MLNPEFMVALGQLISRPPSKMSFDECVKEVEDAMQALKYLDALDHRYADRER